MADELAFTNPIIRGLACAALHPGLRTILLLDATPEQVVWCAALLAQFVAVISGDPTPPPIALSSLDSEDALWGLPFLPDAAGKVRFIQRGCLLGGRDATNQQILSIPDLVQLSLPALRAIIMAADTPVVHLERHGQHLHWAPQLWWVAGCAQADVGQVSPDVLDRFLLRLHVRAPLLDTETARADNLRAQLSNRHIDISPAPPIPALLRETLQQALAYAPELPTSVLAEVLRYVSTTEGYSVRRDLALTRLAVTHAQLAGRTQVESQDVDQAAAVMGFARPEKPSAQQNRETQEQEPQPINEPQPPRPMTSPPPTSPALSIEGSLAPGQEVIQMPVYAPDATQTLSAIPMPASPVTPYPEDHTPPVREAASLQLPFRLHGRTHPTRGPIIGVEPATDLHDLALVSTLFAALKYQAVRHHLSHKSSERLSIRRTDLRRYRRLPTPEMLLVLVLDYTSLRHCDWETALLPHLDWAYISRAAIALIRVGAKQADHELRAERIWGRSLLAPQIGAALGAEAGCATPLAHGLELALQTLRHALQHGRSAIVQARLVVISDGRGNVPLAASHAGQVTLPVNREGIDDALQVALELRRLERVELVCLDPQPSQYAELPQVLADSLGVPLHPIPKHIQISSVETTVSSTEVHS